MRSCRPDTFNVDIIINFIRYVPGPGELATSVLEIKTRESQMRVTNMGINHKFEQDAKKIVRRLTVSHRVRAPNLGRH